MRRSSLSAAQKGDLLDAIYCHVRGEEEPDLDPMTRMAFRFKKPALLTNSGSK